MKNYIAVDAGGSKTRIVVFNEREILEELFITGIGLPIETAEDLPEYRKALTDLQSRHKTAAVAVNLGGRNAMQVQTVTESVFKGCCPRIGGKRFLGFRRARWGKRCASCGDGNHFDRVG